MYELRLVCAQSQVETLSDALQALDALSVSVEDADAHTEAEQALFGEPGMPAPRDGWERSVVLALFSEQSQAREAGRLLQAQDFFDGCSLQGVTAIADQDWVRLTQAQFAPVQITPSFWIVPSWHQLPLAASHSIVLDPGLAFGTGTHPTTRMCLHWIARNPLPAKVLDYGCGSGILAIAAAKFGASAVCAVDIDPAAVQATLDNAKNNAVRLEAGLPDAATGSYALVVANILSSPLKVLAPLLCSLTQSGGRLLLSGILERQAEDLQAAYAQFCQLQVLDTQEGWILMSATLD
ncbi:MAG: 50S ribosomal protein L11 methyltransferase [Rhodoferax sp.]|nr:50S ribosomal protein L11 methyltransferase [Rhodoferax sp.]